MQKWPHNFLPGIIWITSPKNEARAFSYLAYGNESSLETRYSCAAIITIAPPFSEWGGDEGDCEGGLFMMVLLCQLCLAGSIYLHVEIGGTYRRSFGRINVPRQPLETIYRWKVNGALLWSQKIRTACANTNAIILEDCGSVWMRANAGWKQVSKLIFRRKAEEKWKN